MSVLRALLAGLSGDWAAAGLAEEFEETVRGYRERGAWPFD